jgi:hypothetical protein
MQYQPSKSENSRGQNTTFLHRGGKFHPDEAIEKALIEHSDLPSN